MLAPGTYKPSDYNHVTPALVPGRTLVFNGMTGALLELSDEEFAVVSPLLESGTHSVEGELVQKLFAAGCLLPVDVSEMQVIREWRRMAREPREGAPISLTIAPTIQCNLRCTYCFEEHRQEFMKLEVEEAVKAFVTDRFDRGAEGMSVCWFGGEPLLNIATIERLQTFFNEEGDARGFEVAKSMITNGFLLTSRMIERLVALGAWSYLQVTLDWHPDLHNQLRPTRRGKGTWDQIVGNLSAALDAGLPISLRLNTSKKSLGRAPETVAVLVDAGVLPRARPYLGRIFDCTPQSAHVSEEVMTHEEFAQAQLDLQEALLLAGIPSGVGLPKPRRTGLCTADNRNGFVIAPSGLLFKCWNEVHLGPEDSVGNLMAEPHPNAPANLAGWEQYDVFRHDTCNGCKALPNCMGGCPWIARQEGATQGNCGQFRWATEEVLQITHMEQAARVAKQPVPQPVNATAS